MRDERPFLYGGAAEAPLLCPEEDAVYRALAEGGTVPPLPGRLVDRAGSLELIAERLRCDAAVARIRGRVECRAGYGDRRTGDLFVVAACVTIYGAEPTKANYGAVWCLNSAAACRLADRLDSGVPAEEAIGRTLEQCERRELSEGEVRAMEQAAAAWVHEVRTIDDRFRDSPGSEAHREAIRRASIERGS